MKYSFRLAPAILIALISSTLATPRVHTQGGGWQIGDVFAGTGRERTLSGQYLVFNAQGQHKETLTDPFAGRGGTTTGCSVAPPVNGEALYGTTFFNLDVTRFDAASPHTATRPIAGIDYPPVDAIESIVFDTAGNYYVGGLPPARESASDPVQAYGYIFKYSPANVLLATYEVPNGLRGADWIDLGSDEQTLYYTSEDTTVHVYKPGAPSAYRAIVVKDGGAPISGTLYAIRVLPPLPDNTPSGFLVASSRGVLRLDAEGNVRRRYEAPISSGSYLALNITPDGQSFWTATFQDNPEDPRAPYAGQIVKIHIPTGAVTAGPIDTGAPSVWGLCVKREYTAAANTCYVTNPLGQAVPDPVTGQPQTTPCRIPEFCDNGTDDDGDGLGDAGDPDCHVVGNRPPSCAAALASQPLWPPNHEFVDVTVAGVTDPDGDPIAISITAIQQDEPVDVTGSGKATADGAINGAIASVRAERSGRKRAPGDGRVYEIFFTASDGRSGGTCAGSVKVGIPHDQGKMSMPIDSGLRWNSLTGARVF